MISWMASDFFAQSPVLALPVVALVLFVTVFGAVSLRAALKGKGEIDYLSRLPMADDVEGEQS